MCKQAPVQHHMASAFSASNKGYKRYKEGLQPELLADGNWLVKQNLCFQHLLAWRPYSSRLVERRVQGQWDKEARPGTKGQRAQLSAHSCLEHTHTHTHAHPHTRAHTHTHTHSLTRTHTLTHMHMSHVHRACPSPSPLLRRASSRTRTPTHTACPCPDHPQTWGTQRTCFRSSYPTAQTACPCQG
jgi:hypothetical protein